MPLILLFLAGATALYAVADWSALFVGVDGWELALRVLAAGALVWHPIHEQRLGFRYGFNAAVKGYVPARWISGVGSPAVIDQVLKWREHPLSRTMNRIQTAGLVTVFPVLALVGPWWAHVGMLFFYAFDLTWTHVYKEVPGMWSAFVGVLSLSLLTVTAPLLVPGWIVAVAALAGLLLLAAPWVMAYRRVKTS